MQIYIYFQKLGYLSLLMDPYLYTNTPHWALTDPWSFPNWGRGWPGPIVVSPTEKSNWKYDNRRETKNGLSSTKARTQKHSLHTIWMAISISSSKSHLNNETKTINSESLEREIGDQGLRKQILKRGTSWQTPFPGDEVEGSQKIPLLLRNWVWKPRINNYLLLTKFLTLFKTKKLVHI